MNHGFNPGEGWREVSQTEWSFRPDDDEDNIVVKLDGVQHRWVREEPVPALPTAPYTVIRVTWTATWQQKRRPVVLTLGLDGDWWEIGEPQAVSAEALLKQITEFEVLARSAGDYAYDRVTAMEQVRRDTAKAVLEQVRYAIPHSGVEQMEEPLGAIAAEFGVES